MYLGILWLLLQRSILTSFLVVGGAAGPGDNETPGPRIRDGDTELPGVVDGTQGTSKPQWGSWSRGWALEGEILPVVLDSGRG